MADGITRTEIDYIDHAAQDTNNLPPPVAFSPINPRGSDTEPRSGPSIEPLTRADTNESPPLSPIQRRPTRRRTFKTVSDYGDFENLQPGWQPGSEPGFDPAKPYITGPVLTAQCDISVVDFSQSAMALQKFENESFIQFITKPPPTWSKCRWININGLSNDVILAIGRCKNLHRLALEDVIEQNNRTKADWFPTHAFVLLTLQKLVHSLEPDSDPDETDSDNESQASSGKSRSLHSATSRLRRLWRGLRRHFSEPDSVDSESGRGGKAGIRGAGAPYATGNRLSPNTFTRAPDASSSTSLIRTLQRYHASSNEARTQYMEKHSSLSDKGFAISAEQVAIFLTSDNTVITLFEISAPDIEKPIVKRLSLAGTILRQSCDASLVVQAVIDAIIDLAIPIAQIYNEVLGDIELDVLTDPDIRQSRRLYIIISEINKILSFLNPIDNLVNVLRDHRTQLTSDQAQLSLHDPASGVIITQMTHTYLGDVLDHCIIVTEAMAQTKASADNLISLIFNMTSSYQNETMKTLTLITIIFLPLTFITGFFGQNFNDFPEITGSVAYFWKCAAPTVFATVLFIMFPQIQRKLRSFVERRHIFSLRRSTNRNRERERRNKNG